jgi:monoterpene epsilon-lactone hydrolase
MASSRWARFAAKSNAPSYKERLFLYGIVAAGIALTHMTLIYRATISAHSLGEKHAIDKDGTIHVHGFDLPLSPFLSSETGAILKKKWNGNERDSEKETACGPEPTENSRPSEMPSLRKCLAEEFAKNYMPSLLKRFHVTISPERIGGVYVEVFTPARGLAAQNSNRILINVHGGGFIGGARSSSQVESIPISAAGKIKVVSIDYRLGPENSFPAASEDVAAVYRELLRTHNAKEIGVYGCSAGALLTAESIAWFQKQHLPRPGAVAMLCNGAGFWADGDSARIVDAIEGSAIPPLSANPYFRGVKRDDSLAFPVQSTEVMSRFPPSLLLTGTRDFALSSVVHTHSVLVSQNVEADLVVWEGMKHAFIYDPDLPESNQAYSIIARFFDKHLER